MIHFADNDHMNLENIEAFMTLLEAGNRDSNHMNTTEGALSKLHQGN
jgi:hypothetical protein